MPAALRDLDKTFSSDSILRRAEPAPEKPEPTPGIYMLIDGNEVVYVGQSSDMRQRVVTHTNSSKKSFDYVTYIPYSDDTYERLELEKQLEHKFRPRYNGPTKEGAVMTLSQHREAEELAEQDYDPDYIASWLGIKKHQARKICSGHSYMRVYDDQNGL